MGDVAHAALHDRADLALALAGLGGNATHVRDVGHALDHQHVAFLREVVRFELRHPVDVLARAFDRVDALEDVAHGQRRPDHGPARNGRLEHRCADDAAGDAELVHRVGDEPSAIAEREQALDHALGRARDGHQLDVFGRDAAGQSLGLCRVHAGAPSPQLAASRTLYRSWVAQKERGVGRANRRGGMASDAAAILPARTGRVGIAPSCWLHGSARERNAHPTNARDQ